MTVHTKKRILFYTEAPVTGGVSAVVEEVARSAASHYHRTIVCKDNPDLRLWGKKLRALDLAVEHAALKNRMDLLGWFELPRLAGIYQAFRHAHIIHFHLHTTFSCLPAIFIAKLFAGKRVVVTEHYISQLRFIHNKHLPFPFAAFRELMIVLKLALKRLSLRCINQIVTVSEANRRFFLSTFGEQYDGKVVSIPNGVDIERFASVKSSSGKGEPPIIATIAGLNNQKGHEYLIRAIPLIKKHCPSVKFIFAGEGHLRSYLEALAQREGVLDAITFAGNVDDIRSLLVRSTLVVLPSLFEGMPVSVLEAMAAGKAVVATNVDGTVELVVDGLTGFLVPPKNPEQLAEKTVRLLQDRETREMFGRNAQQRVKQFSLEEMAGNYIALFEHLLNDNTTSPQAM